MSEVTAESVTALIQEHVRLIDNGYKETVDRISRIPDERRRQRELHLMLQERQALVDRATKPLFDILAMLPHPLVVTAPIPLAPTSAEE